jgi:hypothetical protein
MTKRSVHDLLDTTISEEIISTEADRNSLRVLLVRLLESEGLLETAPGLPLDDVESPFLLGSMYIDHGELGWSMLVDTASIIVSLLGGGATGTVGAGLASLDLARSIWKNCMKLSARQLAIVAHLRRTQKPAGPDDVAVAISAANAEIRDDLARLAEIGILRRDSQSLYTVDTAKLELV